MNSMPTISHCCSSIAHKSRLYVNTMICKLCKYSLQCVFFHSHIGRQKHLPTCSVIQLSWACLHMLLHENMWPGEQKPSTSRKYWTRVIGNFIRTGRFPAKLRLLHQRVTGGLHCIILNYEARLCYYKDDISSNSQAGQRNTGTHCYE